MAWAALVEFLPWIVRILMIIGALVGGYFIYKTFETTYKGVEQAAPVAGGAIALMTSLMMLMPLFMMLMMMMSLMTSMMRLAW